MIFITEMCGVLFVVFGFCSATMDVRMRWEDLFDSRMWYDELVIWECLLRSTDFQQMLMISNVLPSRVFQLLLGFFSLLNAGFLRQAGLDWTTEIVQVSSLDIRGHGHTSKDKLPAQTMVSSLSSGKDGFDYAISAGSTSPVKLSVVSFFICAFILEAASSYFVRPLRQASTALSVPWKFMFVNICSASNKCNIFRH